MRCCRSIVSVGMFYAAQLTVVFYVLLLLRQFLARFVFSPAWVSVGALVWLTAISTAAGAALMWRNLSTFGNVLDPGTATALNRSVVILAAASLLCLGVAWLRHRSPERRAVWAALLVAIAAGSVVAPLALRGGGIPEVLEARAIDPPVDVPLHDGPGRVTVIAIDAASLDFITRATAEGRLPNFGRILDAGAVRHIATIHPTSAEAVWAAIATGKMPQKNGVRSAGIYRVSSGTGSIQLLPDYCFALPPRALRVSHRAAALLGDVPHADAVEHPGDQRLFGWGGRLAADAAGAGGAWLCRQRRVSPRGDEQGGERRGRDAVSVRTAGRRDRGRG